MYFFKRFFACCLDFLVVGALLLTYFHFFGISVGTEYGGGYTIRNYDWVAIILIWYVYFVMQEYYFNQTLGKMIFGLKIMKTDNSTLRLIDILKRRSFDFIELIFLPLIALILVLTSPNVQRIGDMLGKTKVLDRRIA